jgi:predicted lactoylglutathione lyase
MKKITAQMIFVNLPVQNLHNSIDFFTKLGFTFNPQYTDESATCLILGENIFAMLLTHERFNSFTKERKTIMNAHTSIGAMYGIAVGSREEVDSLTEAAFKAGGTAANEAQDIEGFMYGRSFNDLDGYLWEVFWMNPQAA